MTQTMDRLRAQVVSLWDTLQDADAMTEELYDNAFVHLIDTDRLALKALHDFLADQSDDPQGEREAWKYVRIGNLLHALYPPVEPGEHGWPWLDDFAGEPVDKRSANKFMLGAVIDYRQSAERAWEAAAEYAEGQLGDPESLWDEIVSVPQELWETEDYRKRCGLHRYAQGHKRVYTTAKEIVHRYDGDARKIWLGQTPADARERLLQVKAGKELSRMIVGALSDTGQIEGRGDLKADLQVRRVLGRIFHGDSVSETEAHRIANEIAPDGSWTIDAPLYLHGKDLCGAEPLCDNCPLWLECEYFSNAQTSVPR